MNKTNVRFGLSTPTIDAINSVFSRYPQIEKVIIYGSRAKGNFKPGSDLLLPYKVDLSLFHEIENPDLIDHIQRVGILFYPKQ